MKFNKKITVVSLSTVLGLGLVGSITGAVAWFQYSTRTTSSIIGTSTGESGILQIKSTSGENPQWKRDLITNDVKGTFDGNFLPVTFGGFSSGAALPAKAYSTPVAGEKNMLNWQEAVAGKEYLKYSFNLKAEQLIDGTMTKVAKDVYLTNVTIENNAANNGGTEDTSDDKDILAAVRIHLDVKKGDNHKYFLISNAATSLDTNGKLDLDGDNANDKVGGYEWNYDNTEIVYGKYTVVEQQETLDETKLVSIAQDNSDLIATLGTDGTIKNQSSKSLGQTAADGDNDDLLVTVTIWNEGWALFNNKATWSSAQNGAKFNVGFTFDVGSDAFRAQE